LPFGRRDLLPLQHQRQKLQQTRALHGRLRQWIGQRHEQRFRRQFQFTIRIFPGLARFEDVHPSASDEALRCEIRRMRLDHVVAHDLHRRGTDEIAGDPRSFDKRLT
jgi:hypothetical protein